MLKRELRLFTRYGLKDGHNQKSTDMCPQDFNDHRIFELLATTHQLIKQGRTMEALLPMVDLYRIAQGTSPLPISAAAKEKLTALTQHFVAITTDYIKFAERDLASTLFDKEYESLVSDITSHREL